METVTAFTEKEYMRLCTDWALVKKCPIHREIFRNSPSEYQCNINVNEQNLFLSV